MLQKLFKKILSVFSSSDCEEVNPKKKRNRDNRKISRDQYDYICTQHRLWKELNAANPKSRVTQQQLCEQLNAELGFNKSQRTYSRIWNGEDIYSKFKNEEVQTA